MSARRKVAQKTLGQEIAFLDPLNCDSTLGYRVTKCGGRISGIVDLSDGNRKITWYFSRYDGSVNKIDKAIELLTNFRTLFVEAQKNVRKRRKTSIPA